jgi:hypothetical protein
VKVVSGRSLVHLPVRSALFPRCAIAKCALAQPDMRCPTTSFRLNPPRIALPSNSSSMSYAIRNCLAHDLPSPSRVYWMPLGSFIDPFTWESNYYDEERRKHEPGSRLCYCRASRCSQRDAVTRSRCRRSGPLPKFWDGSQALSNGQVRNSSDSGKVSPVGKTQE